MKPQYVIHLGKNKELSLSELEAVLGKTLNPMGEVVFIEKTEEAPQKFLNQLGGAIKISEVIGEGSAQEITNIITQGLHEQKPSGKLSFGLNLYPNNQRKLEGYLKETKKKLKGMGRNGRFINKRGNLTSAMIVKGGLLKDGTDLNIIQHHGKVMISSTVAVQDFEAYSQRDYEKPMRLAKAGMLPPKLAQAMINLSQIVSGPTDFKGKTLYDPFCGSGTILGEALIKKMGMIGSDLSPEAIEAAQKNISWLQNKYPTTWATKIFLQDATTLTKSILPKSPDLVVTETYLGPPRISTVSPRGIQGIYDELMPLYLNFLTSIHPLLNPKTPLVMAFPVYHTSKGPLRLPNLIEQITPIGYKFHRRLTYHRDDQVVGRDILILEAI